MKKALALILVVVMGMTLMVGCSKKEINNDQSTETGETTETETAAEDQFAEPQKGETVVEIVIKEYGSIFVRFFDSAAPKAVENFLTHAEKGYYDGLTFHRVMNDFMIQGGDPLGTGGGGESIWDANFEDEFSEDLQPYRGALCMANGGPNTNGSQFFIVQSKETYTADVLKDIETQYGTIFDKTAVKNYGELGGTPWLYKMHTVFGQVYDGYEVLDAVAAVAVNAQSSKPDTDVIIEKIKVFEY